MGYVGYSFILYSYLYRSTPISSVQVPEQMDGRKQDVDYELRSKMSSCQ